MSSTAGNHGRSASGRARIRIQISAADTRTHLDQAFDAFARVGHSLGVID